MSLSIGSLFSGIGGMELGLETCGLGPVLWQAESDPYARAVLERHWPGVRRYEDVRCIDATAERPAVIAGGFPCQDLSIAGRQRGLGAERSGLWWEFRRIVRILRPSFVFVENVAHTWRKWVPVVRRFLWKVGYASVPLRVLASEAGAWHERARVFVLATDSHGERLRELSRRRRGQERAAGAPFPADACPTRALADAHREGQLQQARPMGEERRRLGHGDQSRDPWPPEPDLVRVVHGVPSRVDRIRCLGNSVVPRQAALAWRALIASMNPQQQRREQ